MNSDTPSLLPQHSRSRKLVGLRRLLLVVPFAFALAAGLLFPFPVSGRFWNEFFNLAHAPAFFLLTIVAAGVFDPGSIGFSAKHTTLLRITPARAALLSLLVVTVGVGGEVLQQFVGRSASAGDAVANGLGALAAFVWIIACSQSGWMRDCGRFGGGCLLLIGIARPVAELADLHHQHQEFPVLSSLERAREIGIWSPVNAVCERSDHWATHGGWSLQIHLLPGAFSGATLDQPLEDWRGYHHLHFDLKNPTAERLQVSIKIVDRHHADSDFREDDRYLREFAVPPRSESAVSLPLADVRAAPQSREMDLSAVRSVEFYVSDLHAAADLFVDHVRLTRD